MRIVTLTLNPAIDKSTIVDRVVPESKLRCEVPKYEPGGGGINVSRAMKKLGHDSLCIYVAGGPSGDMMGELLGKDAVHQQVLPIADRTRENFIVVNSSTNEQYRFGMPGAVITTEEWESILETIKSLDPFPEFFVASGSLPPSLPMDAYAQIAEIVKDRGGKLILDTSGEPLRTAIDEVGVYLIKPNLRELGQLADLEALAGMQQEEVALDLIAQGKTELVAASLGPRGAMMVSKDMIYYAVPPTTPKNSTVGAGDSMVAGMTICLSEGRNIEDVVKYGVSAGSAATMNYGTELCKKEDADMIYGLLMTRQRVVS